MDVFAFQEAGSSESDSLSQSQYGGNDLGSLPSITTRQSHAFTTVTDKLDDKTTFNETVTEGEESTHDFNRNRILKELIEARHLSPMEFTRKKCMLSSRFSPVKVESILAQCAHKKKLSYKPQRKDAVAIAGVTKLYVYDLVLRAKEIMGNDDSMITPDALRQAALEWKRENASFFPVFFVCFKYAFKYFLNILLFNISCFKYTFQYFLFQIYFFLVFPVSNILLSSISNKHTTYMAFRPQT